MRIRVTLRRPDGDTSTVQVTADGTATVGNVADALAGADPRGDASGARSGFTVRMQGSRGRPPVTIGADTAIIDSGVRSGSTIELVPADDAATPTVGTNAAAVFRVVSGSDRIEVPLSTGTWTIGRSASCTVRLPDVKVSKIHARLVVGAQVEVVDLNSSNGVVVGGVKVGRVALGPQDVVTVGSTQFSVERLRGASDQGAGSSEIRFIRSPRVLARPTETVVDLPDAPRETGKARLPVLALVAPLVIGVVLFATTRSALSLVFVGLSPVLMAGNYVDQRRQSKRKRQSDAEAFAASLAEASDQLRVAHTVERDQLNQLHPTVAECVAAAYARDDLFWSRRPEHPEFLAVRLGTGSISPAVTPGQSAAGLPEQTGAAREVQAAFTRLDDAPVVTDLRSVGGLGVAGEAMVLDGVARALVMQVVTLHSPAEVALACVTSAAGTARWDWLQWLPHTSSPHSPLGPSGHLSADPGSAKLLLDRVDDLIAVRSQSAAGASLRGPLDGNERENAPVLPALVLVIDDPSAITARIVRIAERGPDVGVHVLWVAGSRDAIPAACRTYLDLGNGSRVTAGMVREGVTYDRVACESVAESIAMDVARELAPVLDGGVPVDDDSDLPRSVPVVGLLGHEASDDADIVVTRWRENQSLVDRSSTQHLERDVPSDLRSLVGHTGVEPYVLDLRTHGPHALVGGTTGSGKSEFLQAWVLGMAHANSPDRVTFLFVDYKGGAAFAAFKDLPHAVGVVTDLSPYLVRRALRSLNAELRHRERLLHDKGVKDLVELEMSGDPDCPPSLVIVVDEFAALVGEVPEFVDGVVDVAQRGRSLGLHLILATQNPSNVIKDNIRANTNLRIALRMAEEQHSVDVLGTTLAAHLDPTVPGRGVAKTGPGRLVQFQSAFPGARTPAEPPAPPVEILELTFGSGQQWKVPDSRGVDTSVPKDIERVVGTLARAAELGRVTPPRKPWLDGLADTYDLLGLGQGRDTRIVLGVVDDPDHQAQEREYFRPDEDGNILYIGAGGSGKSTALRTLACASAMTPAEGITHVYGLDFAGGGLSTIEGLPNVGTVVRGDDDERVARLIRHLSAVIEARQVAFNPYRAESLVAYRELAERPREPRILLLVDGFGAFRNEYESSVATMPLYQAFQRILVDGRAVGVHVAMTADRPSLVPTSIGSSFQRKVVLRLADEDAYSAMGVAKDILTTTSRPGRAIQVDRQLEMQLAIVGKELSAAGQARVIDQLAADDELRKLHSLRPEPIRSLPSNVPTGNLPLTLAGQPVLGVEDRTLLPFAFDPTGVMMLAGPAQSGRTTAMRWLAESVRRANPGIHLVHLSFRRSPLSELPLWTDSKSDTSSAAGTVEMAMKWVQTMPQDGIAVFIESLPDFIGSPLESALTELVKHCKRSGHLVVAEGETTTWGNVWPLVMEVRNARTGLLLQPDQTDGDNLLRTALPRTRRADFPPGRGLFVRRGQSVKVQLPQAD